MACALLAIFAVQLSSDGVAAKSKPVTNPVEAVSLSKIPSAFPADSLLVRNQGTGQLPPSAAPDVVGAFRFVCSAGHLGYDDPIVYPGKPGASHLHQFFGNTATDAHSTYESLRTTGESTCGNKLNRSAYWVPAMLNGKGKVIRPDYVTVYYKRLPASSPDCTKFGKACVELPRGLRFVFGFNMFNPADKATGTPHFNCDGKTGKPGHYPDLVAAAANCPPGNRIGMLIAAPHCWDGKRLDSPDHRAHMAHHSYGNWGYARCPATHPFLVPTFTLGVWYTVDEDLDRSGQWSAGTKTWHLSSDAMPGEPPRRPGTTLHSDWFGAWDDDVMAAWTAHCINKMLNCSSANLGNGWKLKPVSADVVRADPHAVDMPPPPAHHDDHGHHTAKPG